MFFYSTLFAQTPAKLPTFNGVKADLGLSWDRYKDLEWMKIRTNQPQAFKDDLDNYSD